MPTTSKLSGAATFTTLPALVGVKGMSTFSGIRTLIAGLGLALACTLALAPPAGAVGQASAAAQFQRGRHRLDVVRRLHQRPTTRPARRSRASARPRSTAAITLKNASGCGLTITGGTETGHAAGTYSHANGYKLDFSRTTCLTGWIHGTYTYIGLRSDGAPMYRSRLRQHLRRRGQPLGRHLLQLRLLASTGRARHLETFLPRKSSWAGSIRRQ